MFEVKYPNIIVKLVDEDGNGFFIIARVKAALKKAKVPETEVKEFVDEAMSGDYNHLLQTCIELVKVK